MAVMSDDDRARVWRALQRYWSIRWEDVPLNKTQVRTTVNETDTWLSDNRTSYTAALTYLNDFTGDQIGLLFGITALMRKGEVELIERALGVEAD